MFQSRTHFTLLRNSAPFETVQLHENEQMVIENVNINKTSAEEDENTLTLTVVSGAELCGERTRSPKKSTYSNSAVVPAGQRAIFENLGAFRSRLAVFFLCRTVTGACAWSVKWNESCWEKAVLKCIVYRRLRPVEEKIRASRTEKLRIVEKIHRTAAKRKRRTDRFVKSDRAR
ncbi:hypothetical protein GWI33_016681 [Rhynchophorus ferrugineus]|uniref:Uncharacterized protein n=1 Tax=Rhynchophorus ferrugineus TaxID=354439 RepID=A0A834I353_RHYFE|nr:hypothetical protein GWI33_016681 [Rhynchophorus ferrugineus]